MMKIEDYKTIFAAVSMAGILILASPTLCLVVRLPEGEKFSELWILGPNHMAEGYPFNIESGKSYLIYVGIGNHMGSSACYTLYVKLRNQTEPLPNSTAGTPSPLPPLYEYTAVVRDGDVWEKPLTFSFPEVSRFENMCLVKSLVINNVAFRVDKQALWDANGTGFYYQIFIELWMFDAGSNSFKYHNRFTGLWLNITG